MRSFYSDLLGIGLMSGIAVVSMLPEVSLGMVCSGSERASASHPISFQEDQDTPISSAQLFLRALSARVDLTQAQSGAVYKRLVAISPFISEPQRQKLRHHLIDLQQEILNADPDRCFVNRHAEEQGDLAMCFLMIPTDAPYSYRAQAVALVQRNGIWQVSLNPGSFANTFLPFDDQIRACAQFLEERGRELAPHLARECSQDAESLVLQKIRNYRQSLAGKEDKEWMRALVVALKGNDPERLAALVIGDDGKQAELSAQIRINPLLSLFRKASCREPHTALTFLSLMSLPESILVPLTPQISDNMETQVIPASDNRNRNLGKSDQNLRCLALLILNKRHNGREDGVDVIVARIPMFQDTDPSDGLPIFRFDYRTPVFLWKQTAERQEDLIGRIASDFHQTYLPLFFSTPNDLATAYLSALRRGDGLSLLRMLHPDEFKDRVRFLKHLETIRDLLNQSSVDAREGHSTQSPDPFIISLQGEGATVRTQVRSDESIPLMFDLRHTPEGWLLQNYQAPTHH